MSGRAKQPASLRSIFGALTLLVTVIAAFVSIALIVVTTLLRATTERSANAVESVWLADEAQIELLLHERAEDPLMKREIAAAVVARLRAARDVTSSAREVAVLDEADRAVDAYFDAVHQERASFEEVENLRGDAHVALEDLGRVNVSQAREAHAAAARWDGLANAVGLAVVLVVTGIAFAVLAWLRRRAFQPLLNLAKQMDRFGWGDRDARAQAAGAREIRTMSLRFNEMANSIAAQRSAQIAFLGSVAHDLRTPLSAMRMSTSLLAAEPPNRGAGEPRHLLHVVERQIARMDRMLGDLLDMSNIEAGVLQLRPESVDVRDLLEHVVALFKDTSRHRLRVHLPDHPVAIRCDPLRIEQVITNLVSNAMKYSPASSSIDIELRRIDDEVEIGVTDEGSGISEADCGRLFEPFRRVGLSRELVPGVGLGLFSVRRIVEAHGGRIAVESKPGAGSTFRVHLPRAAATSDLTHPALMH